MTESFSARRERFRAILEGQDCLRPASVFDPISARIAADIGYETMMMAGSTASLAILGAPDLVVMTLTEFADQARRVTRAADLPLLVDADHGYGNALNARRTVEELEHAGVAAITIEDTALPTPYGAVGKDRLLPTEESVGKIRAALSGRTDKTLTVAARTGALRISGLDDTVARITAYERAGADAIFLSGVKSRDELDALAGATRLPLMLGSVPRSVDDPSYLAGRNVRLALLSHKPMLAGFAAIHQVMRRLRDGEHHSAMSEILSDELLARWSRKAEFEDMRRDFLMAGPSSGQ